MKNIKTNINNIRIKLERLEMRESRLLRAYEEEGVECWDELEAVSRECWNLRDVLSKLMREAY